ncbi:MAG: methyltransferase domain-containing protein [Clostridia bacterium]|nr:methyltransferase domain-containing protein [Clostridia bacterium]
MSILKNCLGLSHEYIKKVLAEGDTAIDATCGNGYDTELLCKLVGDSGHVYGFDVQKQAIDVTKERLKKFNNVTLILDGHENMESYVKDEVSAIMFNFGYLPGGDHAKATKKETSISAVDAGLRLLKKGGLMTLCIYSGGDTGFEEKDAILEFLKGIDAKSFSVLMHNFVNQVNNPPILVCIEKK